MALKNKKILIIIGGGIAAYKSLDLIRLIKKNNNDLNYNSLTNDSVQNSSVEYKSTN